MLPWDANPPVNTKGFEMIHISLWSALEVHLLLPPLEIPSIYFTNHVQGLIEVTNSALPDDLVMSCEWPPRESRWSKLKSPKAALWPLSICPEPIQTWVKTLCLIPQAAAFPCNRLWHSLQNPWRFSVLAETDGTITRALLILFLTNIRGICIRHRFWVLSFLDVKFSCG